MTLRRRELLASIEETKETLQRLTLERVQAESRLHALQSELAGLNAEQGSEPTPPSPSTSPGPQTPAEKVRLFRQLFHGRVDVYPTRFVSKKTNKPGYAPVCSNKFVAGRIDSSELLPM